MHIKQKKIHSLLISLILLFISSSYTMHLSDVTWTSAGVLTTFIDANNIQQVILTRERAGKDKDTYDDFGGASEKYDKHPVFSAAREFYEEAILSKTVGFSLKEARTYIGTAETNTKYLIALLKKDGTYGVTYITDCTEHADQLLSNFYDALSYYQSKKSSKYRKYREKDRIATVPWDTLMETIAAAEHITDITINASVLDPETREYTTQEIQLRPWLVSKLQPFAQQKPYKKGAHPAVRFYSWEYKDIICEKKELSEYE